MQKEITDILVKRLQQRDLTALDYLYDHYSPALYGVISHTLQNEEVAEEVLHDTFLKIWEQIDRYDENKATFFTWIYRIARNKAIDARRSKNFKAQEKSTEIENYVNTLEADENYSDPGLLKAIKELGEACFRLIQLNFFYGYSHGDISKNENIPLGTVKTKMRACLNQLKKKLSYDFE